MGWTYTERRPRQTHLDFFRDEFNDPRHEVIAAAGGLGVVYAALKVTRGGQEPFVIGMVNLINWSPNESLNFGYKDMTEEMGPCEARCPRKILDLLTPLEELERRGILAGLGLEYATSWRARCEQNLAKRKALRLRPGMVLRTTKPIRFTNGQEYDTFEIEDARRLRVSAFYNHRGVDGRIYTLTTPLQFRNRDPLLTAEHVADCWPTR